MNILTFDIEDWYCHDNYSQNFNWTNHEVRIYKPLYKILDCLDENNQKGTFFCLGWLAEHHPLVIKEIDRRGHHIGCHSYQHQLVYRMDKTTFVKDTLKSKLLIEDLIGKSIDSYRAPSYSITNEALYAFEALIELGFKYDCSVFPVNRECGGLYGYGTAEPKIIITKSGEIKEFPMSTFKILGKQIIYSGGGYFRILPYWAIKSMTKNVTYTMSYFHPSDFDPEQPNMTHLPYMRQMKNKVGLKGAYKMFERYLSDFDFCNIIEADRSIDWNIVDKINLY